MDESYDSCLQYLYVGSPLQFRVWTSNIVSTGRINNVLLVLILVYEEVGFFFIFQCELIWYWTSLMRSKVGLASTISLSFFSVSYRCGYVLRACIGCV